MTAPRLALGIDSSTQGTAAVLIDLESPALAAEARVAYRGDPRLAGFGLKGNEFLLPPREEGEADQPVGLFLAALDAVLSDLPRDLLSRVAAVAVSAQQHGQVWLNPRAEGAFRALRLAGAGKPGSPGLAERLASALASGRAPIWMSSNAAREAGELRTTAGGADAMTALSGSDSPVRFTGAVLRRRALREPRTYAACSRIHLISSFLASVLAGRPDAPADWGNGAGTSLMDWAARRWSPVLLEAAAAGLPGGAEGLHARLPALAHPLHVVGTAARYFTERFGIPDDAVVAAGSGDNPQTKVLSPGGLLSLGTSFVLMSEGGRPHPSANAMYDGLGRPFLFGCRTNGSLSWESVRISHGLAGDDFSASERALASTPPGSVLRILQGEPESFPESPPLNLGGRKDFAEDYSGAVDSALGLLWLGSRPFSGDPAGPAAGIAAAGGGAGSVEVLRRVAAIWDRPVRRIGRAGAAAGAAVAAASARIPSEEREEFAARVAAVVADRGPPILPDPAYRAAYHGEEGYLRRLARFFESASGRSL